MAEPSAGGDDAAAGEALPRLSGLSGRAASSGALDPTHTKLDPTLDPTHIKLDPTPAVGWSREAHRRELPRPTRSVAHPGRFVPPELAQLGGALEGGGAPKLVRVERAAVLIADVSGFSAAERNAGASGIDRFSEALNAVLGGLEALVRAHHGAVVHVAGDALICVWVPPCDPLSTSSTAFASAVVCAGTMLYHFDRIAASVDGLIGTPLSMHGSVATGEAQVLHLGGSAKQLTLCGPALERAVEMLAATERGQIAVSRGD